MRGHAKAFDTAKEKLGLTDSLYLGLRTVPVDSIVGSVNRWRDFDARFRIKNRHTMYRYQQIKKAVERGSTLPPVSLYKVRDKYYVVDGNHRVAAAKEVGQAFIDAEVVEFFPPPDSEPNLIWRERSIFEHKTGLSGIELTELGAYDKLLMQIEQYRQEESEALRVDLSLQNAAASWEQEIYKPVVALIREQRLLDEFPGRTEGDLFLYASYHKVAKSRLTKQNVSYKEALADFKVPRPDKSFAEQLKDLITSLFSPDPGDTCPYGLIIDEDGLVRVARDCRGCPHCRDCAADPSKLPTEDELFDY
ncbi:MAG TPA: ParB N-terminal domain-containing protein [Limnochordia bacterium]|nr:ParB N-terminal domain-containing protein [Limnochordia bacterium]HOK30478.1 ParB N-terminal domain-containing protein [Limnochordia bacterium]HOL99280.1 ParB N-terminal domain-containing protein [Limnochordia bacterium]HPP71294.1 ParB N-terminal domain-containing protein [Limnochordia bacterium]HPU64654.1 ParB N-terminal domain-containing protein [Limnochordia bacterium]